MKEKSYKQTFRSFMAGLLTLVLALTPVLSSLPAMQAAAADQKIWYHVEAGSGNGNGHAYSDASSKPSAVLLHQTKKMPASGGTFSVTYEKQGTPGDARLGFFYTYVDDNNFLYVGMNPNGSWYYEYKINGQQDWPSLNLPAQSDGSRTTISVSVSRETMVVNVNDAKVEVTNQLFITLAENAAGNGRFGFRASMYSGQQTSFHFTDAKLNGEDLGGDWAFLSDCEGQVFGAEDPVALHTVSGKVVNTENAPIENANVRIGTESTRTAADGTFSLSVEEGTYDVAVSARGYVANTVPGVVVNADKTLDNIVLTPKTAVVYENYIESGRIKAAVSKTFPQVMQYKLKVSDTEERTFIGQEATLSTIKINGTAITPVIAENAVQIGNDNAVYPMTLQSEENDIDLTMTVKISVSDNDLTWEVTQIQKNEGCAKINTIEVPDLNLVTIVDEQDDCQFMGANVSGDTTSSGDEEATFAKGFAANTSKGFAYGFLSADGVSAGVWSNSEAGSDKRLIRNNSANSMSLTSAPWYYEYGDLPASANYAGTPVSELPSVKVCLAADENADGVVDWQDGAIAYRDIMNNPYGSENTKDLVNYRISMNFSSQATNPYLKTADNIKKVYLATDGLPQAVMMKGYGSEGHDSANSEYGKIADRLGGLEELKKLNTIAHQYNTQMGIHINAQEVYPEAQSFTNELINGPSTLGWGWLDQSYTINRPYDLGSGLRYKRLLQLYDQLNGTSLYANKWPGIVGTGENETVADAATIAETVQNKLDNPEDLDFMYLDVWYGDSWETRKIAQQINSLGWRFSTEFGYEGEYDSTWQHWATEGHYGGAAMKGLNSDVIRFIRNHQKDSFVLNWPSYNGAADNPLLGGYDLSGFEGWGGSNDSFDTYMTKTYAINLPTKFLQHYLVYKWENYEEGQSPVGNHEKQITLKSADGNDTVVVTRNETKRSDDYVERTITLNGKKVLDDVKYLLPWTDSETNYEKLYHYNYEGGETTWELQDDWTSLANVIVYKLTDAGRTEKQTVAVTEGKITLNAEAKTPYIVLKGEEAAKTITNWSEGAHVKDTGFNSYAGTGEGNTLDTAVWSGDVTDAKVVRVVTGNKYLSMGDAAKAVTVSTAITDLKANTDYVAEVYVDNKSDAKAWIEVKGGVKDVSNYTLKSIAGNYTQCDAHNTRGMSDMGGSNMQIMQVSFTAKSEQAQLVLKREAGKGITYFDDIRIVEKSLNNIQADGSFKQDFEEVVQGIYPFVYGPAQGVTDHVTHLSEKNAPYTQSGWGNVVLDDVIEGTWSLKHHGNNSGIIYRTIPQNLHLEPGVTYDVTFDYQAGRDGMYYMVIGDGEKTIDTFDYLAGTAAPAVGQKSTTGTCTFKITGSETGQSWFGLASTRFEEQQGVAYNYGQKDFVLDNLVVTESNMSLGVSKLVLEGIGDVKKLTATFKDSKNRTVTWSSSDEAVATVDENGYVDATGVGTARITATAVDGEEELTVTCPVEVIEEVVEEKAGQFTAVVANTEETSGENAPATKVIDGQNSTFWHSKWSGTGFSVSEDNPAILTLTLKENPDAFNGIQIVQRPTGDNGLVQKAECIVGNSFDEDSNTVGDVVASKTVEVSNAVSGGTVNINLDKLVEGAKYVQIRVLQGNKGFASMAEVRTCTVEEYESLSEEQGAVNDAAEALEGASAAVEAKKDALDALKESQGSAATDLEKAQAAADIAQAELELQNAKIAEAEAKKALADAQKALAEAKAEKATDNDIKARENGKATAAGTASSEAAGSVTSLNGALEALESALAEKNAALDAVKLDSAKKELSETVASAEAVYTQGQKNYTDASWKAFQDAYKAAKEVSSSADLAEVERLKAALAEAQANLTDKSEEELALETAKAKLGTTLAAADKVLAQGQKNYTDASWKAFTDAYNAAKAGQTSTDAAQLNKLEKALADAQKTLAEKTEDPGTKPPVITKDELKNGDTVTVKGILYKVTDASKKTAAVVKGTNKKAASVTIPATVTVKGVSCKVTQISAKAFNGFAKLKKATIGTNVTTIGKQAFNNCKKLSRLTFKGTAVKKIQTGAFKNTAKKIRVTLPKKLTAKKRNSMKKILKKAGISKSAVVK